MKWIGRTVLIIGFWILISPWMAPFLGISQLWNGIFSGAIVLICGLWLLFGGDLSEDTKL